MLLMLLNLATIKAVCKYEKKKRKKEKTLMLGKIEGRWRRGRQRMRWLDGIIGSMDMSLRW